VAHISLPETHVRSQAARHGVSTTLSAWTIDERAWTHQDADDRLAEMLLYWRRCTGSLPHPTIRRPWHHKQTNKCRLTRLQLEPLCRPTSRRLTWTQFGREFGGLPIKRWKLRLPAGHSNLWQVIHVYLSLSSNSIIRYWPKDSNDLRLGE